MRPPDPATGNQAEWDRYRRHCLAQERFHIARHEWHRANAWHLQAQAAAEQAHRLETTRKEH